MVGLLHLEKNALFCEAPLSSKKGGGKKGSINLHSSQGFAIYFLLDLDREKGILLLLFLLIGVYLLYSIVLVSAV